MKWNKLGKTFDPTQVEGRPWCHEFAQCTSVLDTGENHLRVYFSSRRKRDAEGNYVSYTSFLDLDKNDLFKIVQVAKTPVLDLGELGAFDEFGVYPTCVTRVPKFGNLPVLYYAGWTRRVSTFASVSIGLAISNDESGSSFARIGKGPILTNSLHEPFVISGPKVRTYKGKNYMFYLAGEKWLKVNGRSEVIYKIRLATSELDDGINWSKLDINLVPPILEINECQAGPDVFFYDGKYHMYFSYRYGLDFRNANRGYRIGYAYSWDLINWTRDDKNSGISLSRRGWDSTDMHYPHVFEFNGNHYMLYNGNEFGKYGFGLAMMEQ